MCLIHGATAWADMLSEADYFAEQPVVLSVSRLAQPVSRAPAAVTVITREMIEASGYRQLPDLFRLVPGFQVSWQRGNIQAVTYQGLSSIFSRHVQVLVDGRSVYNPGYGSVQWRGIPLAIDDIDRIEVVRGPNAANDGVNSVVASIHIFTRPAADVLGWTVGANAGSREIRDGLLRFSDSSGDWQWRATLNSRQDDWLDNERDDANDHLVDIRAEWRPTVQDEVTFQFGGALGEWDNSSVFTLTPQQTTDYSNAYFQARWQRTLSPDNEWSLLAHHSATHVDEAFTLPGGLLPDNIDYWYSRSGLEFSWQSRPLDSLRAVWTAEVRQDRAHSASIAGPDTHEGAMYRLSGSLEWSATEEWVLHAGAMLEKHYYAGTRLSPRLAVNWLPMPGHSFRLGASRAWRSPTFIEQESDFRLTLGGLTYDQILLSPFKLDPERMDSAELGYLYHQDKLGLDLDVRLFHNRLSDMIDIDTSYAGIVEIDNSISNIVFANLYEAKQWGGEYQLRWRAGKASWITLSQSWVQTRGDTPDISKSAPAFNFSLLASHDFGPVTGSLGYHKVGKMRWINSDALVPAHDRLDLRLSYPFKTRDLRGEIALVAQGVLGDYVEWDYDNPGFLNLVFEPRAYVSVKLHF